MTAEEWAALEADPRVRIAADGSFVGDRHDHPEGGEES